MKVQLEVTPAAVLASLSDAELMQEVWRRLDAARTPPAPPGPPSSEQERCIAAIESLYETREPYVRHWGERFIAAIRATAPAGDVAHREDAEP